MERIFVNYIFDKDLVFKTYKELLQFNNKKTYSKRGQDLEQTFSKGDIQMAYKHMKRCSTSLAFREITIKTTTRQHSHLEECLHPHKSENNKHWQGGGEIRRYTANGNVKRYSKYGKQLGGSSKMSF